MNDGRKVRLLSAQRGIGQKLSHPDDPIHWGANFVTHPGKKCTFRSTGGLRLVTLYLQLQNQSCQTLVSLGDSFEHDVETFHERTEFVV